MAGIITKRIWQPCIQTACGCQAKFLTSAKFLIYDCL